MISTHQVRDLENLIDALVIIEKSRILVNTTVEQITDHFVFRQLREGETALFAEESLRGRWGMVPTYSRKIANWIWNCFLMRFWNIRRRLKKF